MIIPQNQGFLDTAEEEAYVQLERRVVSIHRRGREGLIHPDLAEELRIPRTRAYELIARGDLPAVRIGKRSIRVNRRELERFLFETRRVTSQ